MSEVGVFSDWRRWDLHVHTPESFEHSFKLTGQTIEGNPQDLLWEKYLETLENQNEVKCIGITDYFSIEGYRKVIEARKNGRLSNFDIILPNIEFRTADTFYFENGKEKRLNFHVIFSDSLPAEIIEREFLNALTFKDERRQEQSLHRHNLEALSARLKRHQASFERESDYAVGCKTAGIDLDLIYETLRKKASFFEGKYLTVLASENLSDLKWDGQGHLKRKHLLHYADAVFSGNPGDRDFLLGKKGDLFLDEFGKYWPVLHGSDAHRFDTIFQPNLKRYCWIKSLPTFEGLKQIIYEPEQRIHIGELRPTFTQYGFAIDEVGINDKRTSPPVKISESNLTLSRGLVAVIGGKGSGKTALLDLIANNFENRTLAGLKNSERPASEIASSFVARNTKARSEGVLETSILFLNKDEFSKNMDDGDSLHSSNITYLSQGKLEDYSADSRKLQNKIREVIFNKIRVFRPELADKYDTARQSINSLREHMNATLADIRNNYHKLRQLDMKRLLASQEEKSQAVMSTDHEIKSLLELNDQDRFERISHNQKELEDKKHKYNKIQQDITQLETRIQIVDRENAKISEINNLIHSIKDDLTIPLINVPEIQASLRIISNELGTLASDVEAKRAEAAREIESMSTQKEKVESLQRKREADQLILDKLKADTALFEEYVDTIRQLRDEQAQNIAKYIDGFVQIQKIYNEIISEYSNYMPEILKGVEFESAIKVDHERWAESIFNLLDSRKKIGLSDIEELLSEIDLNKSDQIPEAVKVASNKIVMLSDSLKKSKDVQDLEEAFYSFPIALNTSIKYNGILMENLSMGQRGTVLLNIYLADGENTLIIDQPEENLDNKYIYEVLVSAIKRAKLNRQIIIATHNANLVVNTDAEQVLIAEYMDGEINYLNGCIEDQKTRDEIALILEGGREAFEKREARYRASNQL